MDIFKENIPTKNISNIALSNLTDEVFCRYVNSVFLDNDEYILIVTPSLFEANQLYDNLLKS